MENNINKQNKLLNNMRKLLINMGAIILILIFSVTGVFSLNQEEILNFQFEEGSGSVTVDISPPSNIGILSNTGWTAQYSGRWGYYAPNFANNGNNVIDTTLNQKPNSTLVMSMWIRPINNDYDIPVSLYDTADQTHIGLLFDANAGKGFYYYDTTNTYKEVIFETTILPTNTWYHLVVELDLLNHRVIYYRNNVLIYNNTFVNNVQYTENQTMKLRLGTDKWLTNDFGGQIDSFRLFNEMLTPSQITSLYTSNIIMLEVENPQFINYINNTYNTNYSIYTTYNITDNYFYNYTTINEYNMTFNEYVTNYIFNDTNVAHSVPENFLVWVSPSATTQNVEVVFKGGLNKSATCDLYIDNKVEKTFTNIMAFSYKKLFESHTTHNYFVYCSYKLGEITMYDISPPVNFDVEMGSRAIEFFFYDTNTENLLGEDFYLSTPCFENLMGSSYYTPENEYYVKNLKNGYAQFNLSYISEYEFCLYRGNINLNSEIDTFTKQINVVELKKEIPLGVLIIGSNTSSYQLNIDDYDKYSPTEPEFWGKDWKSLYSLITALIIGGIFVTIGVYARSDRIVVIGGLIILAGMGISLGGLFFGMLF
jgi:hypothetical protein